MPKNIMIVTASWRMPVDTDRFLRVGISRMPPRHIRGYRTYPPLFPGPWWRSISEPEAWAARYREDLDRLDSARVIADLTRMVPDGRSVALCCWEPPPPSVEWCHRGLIAEWLHIKLDIEVPDIARRSGWEPRVNQDEKWRSGERIIVAGGRCWQALIDAGAAV